MEPTSPPSSRRRQAASVIVLEDYSDADMTVQRAPLRASDLPQFDLEPICDSLPPGVDPNATVRRGAMDDSVAAIVLGRAPASHPQSYPPVALNDAGNDAGSDAGLFAADAADRQVIRRERALRIGALALAAIFCGSVWTSLALHTDPASRNATLVSASMATKLAGRIATAVTATLRAE